MDLIGSLVCHVLFSLWLYCLHGMLYGEKEKIFQKSKPSDNDSFTLAHRAIAFNFALKQTYGSVRAEVFCGDSKQLLLKHRLTSRFSLTKLFFSLTNHFLFLSIKHS